MNIILSHVEVESRFIASQQCTQEFLSSLRDQIEALTARLQICCAGSSSSSLPPASSSSSLECSPCGFGNIGHLFGTSTEFTGDVQIFGQTNILTPLEVSSPPDTFHFPWPAMVTARDCHFAYYSPGSWSNVVSVPALMIIWDDGEWQLYRSYEVRDGRGVSKIGNTSPVAYSLELPLGNLTFHTITAGTLTLHVDLQVCSGESSSSSHVSCYAPGQITHVNAVLATGSQFINETALAFVPTTNQQPGLFPTSTWLQAPITPKIGAPVGIQSPLYLIFNEAAGVNPIGLYVYAWNTAHSGFLSLAKSETFDASCHTHTTQIVEHGSDSVDRFYQLTYLP